MKKKNVHVGYEYLLEEMINHIISLKKYLTFIKFCNLDCLASSYIRQVDTGHVRKFGCFNITSQCSNVGPLKTAYFG